MLDFKSLVARLAALAPASVQLVIPPSEEHNAIHKIAMAFSPQLKLVAKPFNVLVYSVSSGVRQIAWNSSGLCEDDYTTPENASAVKGPDTFAVWAKDFAKKSVKFRSSEIDPEYTLFIALDCGVCLKPDSNPYLVRQWKELLQAVERSHCRLIILDSQPVELTKAVDGLIVQMRFQQPSESEIFQTIELAIMDLIECGFPSDLDTEVNYQALVRQASGLTLAEIQQVCNYSARYHGRIGVELIDDLRDRKIETLKKLGLEFFDNPKTRIGGLGNLKQWCDRRSVLFSAALDSTQNLPVPKGVLMCGVPGTGKSLTAKTIGAKWNLPVVRFNIAAVLQSLVGESEKKIELILKSVESVAPCVLCIDEIEKIFSRNNNDSGVTTRVLGALLSWMQDRKSSVFVVATANDIELLPPELKRKGRFDEVFFLDLPNQVERVEILEYNLSRYGVSLNEAILNETARDLEGYVGAEIEAIVDEARLLAYIDNSNIDRAHLLKAISETSPMSRTNSRQIAALRQWAVENNIRIANTSEPKKVNRLREIV